jgi:hypothetical protein
MWMDALFPGGNVCWERTVGDCVYFRPDLRDNAESWFYWYFRVREAAGRTLTFVCSAGNVFTTLGPCLSLDGGVTWNWLGRSSGPEDRFTYQVPKEVDEVRFALSFPYLETHLQGFLRRHDGSAHLACETLTQDRHGRRCEWLRVGCLDGNARYRVFLAARHHACESMASYALEGLLEAVLADSRLGAWFRDNVEVAAVPFVDKEGVENGAQGKCRAPHDHNRDYFDEPIYPTVRAIRERVPVWAAEGLDVAFDLHCPWIRGGRNEELFFAGPRNPRAWEGLQAFSQILEGKQLGMLPFSTENNLPYGQEWNVSTEPRSCTAFMSNLPGIRAAGTLEVPYALCHDQPVTPEACRTVGRDLAVALQIFLEDH